MVSAAPDSRDLKFWRCNPIQMKVIENAVVAADWLTIDAREYLAKLTEEQQGFYPNYFGTYDKVHSRIVDAHFDIIQGMSANPEENPKPIYDCIKCMTEKPGTYAKRNSYVLGGRIALCGRFWNENLDKQVVAILHLKLQYYKPKMDTKTGTLLGNNNPGSATEEKIWKVDNTNYVKLLHPNIGRVRQTVFKDCEGKQDQIRAAAEASDLHVQYAQTFLPPQTELIHNFYTTYFGPYDEARVKIIQGHYRVIQGKATSLLYDCSRCKYNHPDNYAKMKTYVGQTSVVLCDDFWNSRVNGRRSQAGIILRANMQLHKEQIEKETNYVKQQLHIEPEQAEHMQGFTISPYQRFAERVYIDFDKLTGPSKDVGPSQDVGPSRKRPHVSSEGDGKGSSRRKHGKGPM
ncbi:hypothetical protein RSOL_027830 [Rhizoctonia solani AG-3 Rhs1AP]|uniref:Lysine-specific metallo-endopeptidase domain-containing protein n=2 Tax=Rhizoctonia solani AG-3 TaxID=1086053 RepID=A0A074RLY8_9AGAM|nr:hypothetical protein RSOL_027830 [Rhizoctonia solani AG-3 Rhs1AP]KEP46345.1 hypothetical protein V565_204050 [Rhizoctonia solani 123E]